jgi:hypothetical protein
LRRSRGQVRLHGRDDGRHVCDGRAGDGGACCPGCDLAARASEDGLFGQTPLNLHVQSAAPGATVEDICRGKRAKGLGNSMAKGDGRRRAMRRGNAAIVHLGRLVGWMDDGWTGQSSRAVDLTLCGPRPPRLGERAGGGDWARFGRDGVADRGLSIGRRRKDADDPRTNAKRRGAGRGASR